MNKKDIELFKQAVKDKGIVLFQAEEYKYGDLVIPFAAEILGISIEKQICRVVQIRKEIGQFGSDLFFVRHADGDLFVWENQHFYKVKEKYIQQIETVYNQHDAIEIDDDKPDVGYRYSGNKEFIKGFIIPSPYPADHVTPMKAVQAGIKSRIEDIINS